MVRGHCCQKPGLLFALLEEERERGNILVRKLEELNGITEVNIQLNFVLKRLNVKANTLNK